MTSESMGIFGRVGVGYFFAIKKSLRLLSITILCDKMNWGLYG